MKMKKCLLFLTTGGLFGCYALIWMYLDNSRSVYIYKNHHEILHQDINFPYVQESVLSPSMAVFDHEYSYLEQKVPKKYLTGQNKDIYENIFAKAAEKLKTTSSEFSIGRYRMLKEGIEYDLLSENKSKRISIFQRFSANISYREISYNSEQEIHMILPLQGRLDAFEKFLRYFASSIGRSERNLSLAVAYFSDESAADARKLMQDVLGTGVGTPSERWLRWSFFEVPEGRFSRGRGVSFALDKLSLSPNDLVFVCDVDVLVKTQFFARCRANAVLNKQVYFPIIFSLYNPELVYLMREDSVPAIEDQLKVAEDNGFWRSFGFGMFCMFKSELDRAGGLPELTSWGREDVLLFEAIAKNPSIKVIRSHDPSIFHLYHGKHCSGVSHVSYPSCLTSKAVSEGTQKQLALLLFKTTENIDVEGILSKRFYYFYWFPILVGTVLALLAVNAYLCFQLKLARAACRGRSIGRSGESPPAGSILSQSPNLNRIQTT